jgi:hypothetical protein
MTEIDIGSITCSDHSKSCPGTEVNLSGHENLQQFGLTDVPVSQLQVNTLLLEECWFGALTSNVITSWLTCLPSALNLHKFYCHNLNDTDISTLTATIPALTQLEELYIHQTNLTENRLDLTTDMTRLRYIHLGDVSMTSSDLRAMSRTVSALSQSVTTVLSYCTVTPEAEYKTLKKEIWESDMFSVIFDGLDEYNRSEFCFKTLEKK